MANTAVIAGLGPGFCERFAEALAADGYALGLFGRSESYLEEYAAGLRADGHDALAVPTDVTDPEQVAAGFDRVREELGPVEVLAYTASASTDGDGDELDPARFESRWRLYAYGGLLCVREAIDDLRATDGTVLFFGASPGAGDLAYRSGKDAARGLARRLADEYGPAGVHVAHVVIGGGIRNPDVYDGPGEVNEEAYLDPGRVAETCMHLVRQDDGARTFELDLRPETWTD